MNIQWKWERFKELDLIDRVPKDGGPWHYTGDRNQDHPQGKEMQKSKMAVWGGLTNSCEKKWKAKEKRKEIPIWMQNSKEFQREIRKPSQWSVQRKRRK